MQRRAVIFSVADHNMFVSVKTDSRIVEDLGLWRTSFFIGLGERISRSLSLGRQFLQSVAWRLASDGRPYSEWRENWKERQDGLNLRPLDTSTLTLVDSQYDH